MATFAALIVVLGILIFVHELGHFVVAKAVGVRVLTFSLGFGPRLISFTRGETEYAVCLLPFGGYVKMAGEDPEDLSKAAKEGRNPEPGDFAYSTIPRRLGIITAGPAMNVLLAFVIYLGCNLVAGLTIVSTTTVGHVQPASLAAEAGFIKGDTIVLVDGDTTDNWFDMLQQVQEGIGITHEVTVDRDGRYLKLSLPSLLGSDGGLTEGADVGYGLDPPFGSRVKEVLDSTAAAAVGLQGGDRIIRVGDNTVSTWWELTDAIQAYPGITTEIQYLRGEELSMVEVTPERVIDDSTGQVSAWLGISIDTEDLPYEHMNLNLSESIGMAATRTWKMGTLITDILVRLVSGQISMRKSIGGPVTIAKVARESARSGLLSLLLFIAFVSVNLGVLNLLPIPVLDGGHLVFLAAEAVRGKPLSLKVRLAATQIGMAFIILLMLYVTINDFVRLF